MGFLNPGDKPLIWRGPMLHSVMQQFIRQVDWGELDYLLVDLPPGTGDVALSLIQTVPITGAVVVSTPSEVALEDGRKAVLMFQQVKVALLGIVENMSYLIVPETGQKIDIFGQGGGRRTAEAMDVPFLGELPLNPQVRVGGDSGRPVALAGPEDAHAGPFYEMAQRLMERCASSAKPGVSFSIED
jgi:ATP-binding protein involved in chromosome partitioning